MAITQLTTRQLGNSSVQRADLDAVTAGQAVICKVIAGANISLSSTGADAGTGDVTISVTGISGGFGNSYVQAANVTLSTDMSIIFPSQYYITSTFTLTLAGTSIFAID